MEKEHVKLKLNEIKEWNKNPKKHADELIESSIKEFGYIEDIVVDENNRIIAGHGRFKALKKLGIDEVDVIRVRGLTEEQKEKYALLSNKSGEKGGWDFDLLKEFNEDLLKEVGFNESELDEIFGLEIDDEFDVEKEFEKVLKSKKRRVKDGDLWQLGEYCICPHCKKEIDLDKTN